MTLFTAAWTWTLLRSLLVIILALPCCGLLVRWIRGSRGWQQVTQWSLLSVPFLFPELLTGYAYGQTTRLMITGPWVRELWFDLLLVLRVIPIGTLLWYCSRPSPLSREAVHARALGFRSSDSSLRRFFVMTWYHLQGPARTAVFASCGLFLSLFQEFELASLLAVKSWTVWLFDAQAEGLPLLESLRCVAVPAFVTWIACSSLLLNFLDSPLKSAAHSSQPRCLSLGVQLGLWVYLIAACVLIGIYPFILIGLEGMQGVLALTGNAIQLTGLTQGILIAGGCALIASVLAEMIAETIICGLRGRWRLAAIWCASYGLVGSLAVGLTVVALVQLPGLLILRETPIPVILGFVIWLVPRAVVLQGIRHSLHSPIASHAAALLAAATDSKRQRTARQLAWLIEGRPRFAARVLLFHWSYWDLTLPHLLNPTGLVPAPVRLYADAHFARNAMLTAKAGITMLAPVVVLLLIWGLIRLWGFVVDAVLKK